MKVNPHMFRGYDLRGIVGEDLNPEIVEHLGKAFGTMLKRNSIKKAVVGRDCRETGPEYSEAFIKGLNWTGIDVIDIGMTLVGTFYWAQYYLDCKGGAFVTASHNPPQFNGFKFANDFSETLVSENIQELRKMAEDDDIEQGEEGSVEKVDVTADYYSDLKKRFNITKKFKVVVDPSNTTAGAIIPNLLREVGCEVIEKNTKIDSSFPLGTPDPTETAVAERLSKEVSEAGADIGFSYDADGDRIGIVDEKGGIIWNDVLVAIFAKDVLYHHPESKIMYNTLCSRVVPETISAEGGEPFMWRTGHSFLKKKNQEVGATFIGELSGHFFFSKDFYNHDDGAYSTLRVLDYLSRTGQKLSDAVASLDLYISSPEIKVFCADDKKVALMGKLAKVLEQDFSEADVQDGESVGDGVRLDLDDGMFVVRYSQNGPYLTIKYEGKSQERYDKLRKYIDELLHKYDEIDWGSDINVNLESLI